jgi:transcriptional regulator with XRE-family HTH domain
MKESAMTEKERQALAAIMRDRRQERGISARELARQAGVDKATITLLEQCKIAHPRVETIRALANVLELPLADIYAATNWLPENSLPSLRPYMRAKYGELTDDELSQVETFISQLGIHPTAGPRPGEDE